MKQWSILPCVTKYKILEQAFTSRSIYIELWRANSAGLLCVCKFKIHFLEISKNNLFVNIGPLLSWLDLNTGINSLCLRNRM